MRLSRLFTPLFIAMTVITPLHGHISAQAVPSEATKTFRRAVTTYKAETTLRVEFEQTLTSALTGAKSTSRGEMIRKQPNLFTINFKDPTSDRIVCDGKHIWLYLPSTAPNQVIKVPLDQRRSMLVDPLDQILSLSEDSYSAKSAGRTEIRGRATTAVTITPKNTASTPLTSATIWIDDKDGTVRQFQTKEPSGLERIVVVTKYTAGETVPKSAFAFKPGLKMRVVDQRLR